MIGFSIAYLNREALYAPPKTVETESTTFGGSEYESLAAKLSNPLPLESASPHQFLHLHHMKTGGTSMDALVRCSQHVYEQKHAHRVPYYNLHECSARRYTMCVSGQDSRCLDTVQNATVLSYCAPLRDLPTFRWEAPAGAVTVLRHPVDRVWSMYRFRTKGCYQCRPLLEILNEMEDSDGMSGDLCKDQLINHQTNNLLSTLTLQDDPDAVVNQAIQNLRSFFTLVGLTSDLPTSVAMARKIFPWMNDEKACPLQHRNASPQHNGCGESNGHLALPDHPDEETEQAIRRLNQLDLRVYEAALEVFEQQKQALGM